jgi:hypothetical protein
MLLGAFEGTLPGRISRYSSSKEGMMKQDYTKTIEEKIREEYSSLSPARIEQIVKEAEEEVEEDEKNNF